MGWAEIKTSCVGGGGKILTKSHGWWAGGRKSWGGREGNFGGKPLGEDQLRGSGEGKIWRENTPGRSRRGAEPVERGWCRGWEGGQGSWEGSLRSETPQEDQLSRGARQGWSSAGGFGVGCSDGQGEGWGGRGGTS